MLAIGDDPVEDPDHDALGRGEFATELAADLAESDVSKGAVVAIIGPWGSGKTSFINLLRLKLEDELDIPVLDFNPWLFSGAEQLVDSFFGELSAQLRLKGGRLLGIAQGLEAYGELLSPLSSIPFIGPWVGRLKEAGAAVKTFQEKSRQSVAGKRQQLSDELAKLEKPIVVVIDDIDRLESTEVRHIFKLVRLTASFPNVVYLLSFDRARVESALDEQNGLNGRDYLEKIVQIPKDLPVVPGDVLLRELTKALNEALDSVGESTLFDQGRWQDVALEIVSPLITTMRDVRRYAYSVRGTFRTLKAEVSLVDILALEAVRLFLPDVFGHIGSSRKALTKVFPIFSGSEDRTQEAAEIREFIERAKPHEEVANSLVERIFPAGLQHLGNNAFDERSLDGWLRDRRVAHSDILSLYLERVKNSGFTAFAKAEHAHSLLAREDELDSYLRTIERETLAEVIAGIRTFRPNYPEESIVSASVVLLNLIPDMPERSPDGGMFAIAPRNAIGSVVLCIFETIYDTEVANEYARRIASRLTSFAARLEFCRILHNATSKDKILVSQEISKEIDDQLLNDFSEASFDDIAEEAGLIRLLLWVREKRDAERPILDTQSGVAINGAVLRQARSDATVATTGTRSVSVVRRLGWDALLALYGTEETISSVVDSVRDFAPDDEILSSNLSLADAYLDGWNPDDF